MSRPNNESIWGNINSILEISLNIYEIYAEHGEGIFVMKEAKNTLSDKALALGQETEEYIAFDDSVKDVAMYEILKAKNENSEVYNMDDIRQIADIESTGKYRYPEYFGEIEMPQDSKEEVCRGIHFINTRQGLELAIHQNVAADYMTEMSREAGSRQGEYLTYNLNLACMPIFELSKVFTEVNALVLQKDSLYATLTENFTAYTEEYNLEAHHDQIPNVIAPKNLYLAEQLKVAQHSMNYEHEEQTTELGKEVDDYELDRNQ